MINRFSSAALVALLAALPLSAFADAPAAVPPTATPVVAPATIDRSGDTTIIRQQDSGATLVGVQIVIRAGLNRQSLLQSGLAALTAESILRAPVGTGVPLEDAIAANGGSIKFTVDPDDVHFYVESLPEKAAASLALVDQALSAPQLTPAAVNDARSVQNRRIIDANGTALQVGIDMLNRADATPANVALSPLGSAATLAQFVPADVRAFYQTYYRRGGGVVSAIGRLDLLPANALGAVVNALPAGSTQALAVHIPELKGTSHELVARRDVSAPWFIAQFAAPPLDSKDFGAMLVVTAFVQRNLATLVQVPGVVSKTYASHSVGAIYSYDRPDAGLVLYVNGSIGDPERSFQMAISIVNILATSKLNSSVDDFKAIAFGDFAANATTLESRSWLAVVFSQGNASPDYVNRAMNAISAVTSDDVQRVARTYLSNPTVALVLPREQGI